MPLQILGLNHNTAPLEIREQLVFAGDEIPRALERLTALDGVDEAVLLSTCNRTEFYLVADGKGHESLKQWLSSSRKLDEGFRDSLFALEEAEARDSQSPGNVDTLSMRFKVPLVGSSRYAVT